MPPAKRKTKSKQKKLAVPKELKETVDETIEDSDTVVGDVNDNDLAFIYDATDDTDADEGAKGGKKAVSKKKQISSNKADGSSTPNASQQHHALVEHDARKH